MPYHLSTGARDYDTDRAYLIKNANIFLILTLGLTANESIQISTV